MEGNNIENEGHLVQWKQTVDDLGWLLVQHGDTNETYIPSEISRRHWKASNTITQCAAGCGRKFGLVERIHHCRRCGDLFCRPCVGYLRCLNLLAQPDPSGKMYKVCKACFDQGPQTLGQWRRWTDIYTHFRQCQGTPEVHGTKLGPRNYRDRLNFIHECERLTGGFEENIQSGPVKKLIKDIKKMVKVPDWHKSPMWTFEQLAQTCRTCQREFSVLTLRHNCVVCGISVCDKCSSMDLIVYVPYDEVKESGDKYVKPKLAVIKVVGCPDVEPDVCMYLRVCGACQNKVEDQQVAAYMEGNDARTVTTDTWICLMDIYSSIVKIHETIDSQLPKYQELVESLEGSRTQQNQERNNTLILAKAQGDLADSFIRLILTLQELKKLQPKTQCQTTVLRNVVRSKVSYYQENMFIYRDLKRKLSEFLPDQVLQCIQDTVDKNAINSCYLSMKQLLFEALHLCSKYKLQDLIPPLLTSAEQVVEEELKTCLAKLGEGWEEHEHTANLLLKEQLLQKSKRLIRPSRKLTERYGAQHVEEILLERCVSITQQIVLQLQAKCALRNYLRSKKELENLHASLLHMQKELSTRDFELV